jgi:hypothetical protein
MEELLEAVFSMQSMPRLHKELIVHYEFPGGYKYRDLALQVRGVSDETVKYGREFCGTSAQE